jgi:hypothetical protein
MNTGAFVVLKECAKVLWKSQPIWALVIMGFLIYKANVCNIELYRNNRYPVWAGYPLVGMYFQITLVDRTLHHFIFPFHPIF